MGSFGFRLKFFMAVLLAVMLMGTLGFSYLQNLSLIDAFYFTIVTIATVGYGDIVPTTQAGRVLAVILIITGVGTFLGVVVNATEAFIVKREKQQRMEKLRMVMGLFFSEFGTDLLARLARNDPNIEAVREQLLIKAQWSEKEFQGADTAVRTYPCLCSTGSVTLKELRELLEQKRELFLRLFENPNLLEHESFTELLRAILHLKEELLHRDDLDSLPQSDVEHLTGDIRRVYSLLLPEWLDYMRYLKQNYPYLFSLAMRLNPFDRNASVVVRLDS